MIRILLCVLLFMPAISSAHVSGVDSRGVSITLPHPPQKIACLYAFTGHTAVMLGKGSHIVAIVRGLKRDKLLTRLYPQIKNIPVPSRGGDIQIEGLLQTAPDIVFLKPETAAIDAEIAKLQRFKIPYFVAGYNSMEQQISIINNIGILLNAKTKAKAYTDYYRQTITRVEAISKTIPENQRVRFYHSVNEIYRTDAPASLEADWTSKCGAINVSLTGNLHQKSDKYFASMEQILYWNPQVIIANEESAKREIEQSSQWKHIDAVKNARVFTLPVGISRWGHPGGLETPLAMLWTIKTLYPQYTQGIDLKTEAKVFYKTFFDLELSDNEVQNILAGKGMRRDKQKRSKN